MSESSCLIEDFLWEVEKLWLRVERVSIECFEISPAGIRDL